MTGVVVLATVAAEAGHPCSSWSTSTPDLTVDGSPVEQPTYYLVDWLCPAKSCAMFPYVYEEANGIPGLQRGDAFVDDTCHGQVPRDRIVY